MPCVPCVRVTRFDLRGPPANLTEVGATQSNIRRCWGSSVPGPEKSTYWPCGARRFMRRNPPLPRICSGGPHSDRPDSANVPRDFTASQFLLARFDDKYLSTG